MKKDRREMSSLFLKHYNLLYASSEMLYCMCFFPFSKGLISPLNSIPLSQFKNKTKQQTLLPPLPATHTIHWT